MVVFNGIMFPEAVARLVARRAGVPVITHEVGLQPHSAFFSAHEATFREIDIALEGRLDAAQSERLDDYLGGRFRGRFRMAGIDFWPVMEPLPPSLEARLTGYHQVATIFTNVVFDTSQVHANSLFPTMFEWLEDLGRAFQHPETLFVFASPDVRPGKQSQQSVAGWLVAPGCGTAHLFLLGPSTTSVRMT
jgi:hypothetical protein